MADFRSPTSDFRPRMTYSELTVLIPCHSLEDFPTELGEQPSEGLLNAFAVLWHPALIATAGVMPRWRRADEVHSVQQDRLYILPTACTDWVSHGWAEDTRKAGAAVVSGVTERQEMIRQALAPLENPPQVDPDLAADFLAFGACYLLTELLTRKMRNFSHVDEVHLQREAVAAARAAVQNDRVAAETHLRYCFEMLLECRERFYPVDCYLIDLCLVAPKFAGEHLRARLAKPTPVSLLSTAVDWQTITAEDPDVRDTIRRLWRDGRVDLVGGEYRETATPLLSVQSVIWQLQRGADAYRTLFDRTPSTWGRKRFGVDPTMPLLINRAGMSAGLHFVIDDGIYPDQEHAKLRWTGADGTVIDAFSRIPLAADSASSMLRFPTRMAESMDHDQTAAIAFAAWPELRTPWLDDLRRMSKYAPVLGRFVTFRQFFDAGDMPGKMVEYKTSEYLTPNLVQAVAREEADAISRHIDYWQRRARFESLEWSRNLTALLQHGAIDAAQQTAAQETIENADPDATAETKQAADALLTEATTQAPRQLAEILARSSTGGPGMLVVNPLSFPRSIAVDWNQEVPPPATSDVVKARQFDESRSTAVVEVPACGFAWVAGSGPAARPDPKPAKVAMAEELLLRNDFLEVALSEVTGGIGQIRGYGRGGNRISQQLAYRFPRERTITIGEGEQEETYKSFYSEMRMREWRVLSAGPAVGEIETIGDIIDQQQNKLLAVYRQVTRVVRGRPFVEVEIELGCQTTPDGDPWTNYYAARFAWKYETVALSASLHHGAHVVNNERIEAPQFLELADEDSRTTILPCGLPYHRKTGPRMLDTLLVVAGETRRKFRFAIALDQPYPIQSALDVAAPPFAVTTAGSPPNGATTGWLFHLSAGNIQLTRLLPLFPEDVAAGLPTAPPRKGCIVRLVETEGRRKTTILRCFRTPTAARQVDFHGQTVNQLYLEGDGVRVDVRPYEVCDVEVTW